MPAKRVKFSGSLTIHETQSDADAKRIVEKHVAESLKGTAPEKTYVDDVKAYADDVSEAKE